MKTVAVILFCLVAVVVVAAGLYFFISGRKSSDLEVSVKKTAENVFKIRVKTEKIKKFLQYDVAEGKFLRAADGLPCTFIIGKANELYIFQKGENLMVLKPEDEEFVEVETSKSEDDDWDD